jgi:hypothetical protein
VIGPAKLVGTPVVPTDTTAGKVVMFDCVALSTVKALATGPTTFDPGIELGIDPGAPCGPSGPSGPSGP